MTSKNLAVSRIDRPGEIDFYLAYENASAAGDAVNDEDGVGAAKRRFWRHKKTKPGAAPTDEPVDTAHSTKMTPNHSDGPLRVPDKVLDDWKSPPPGWPRALSWPPAAVFDALEVAATHVDARDTLVRAARGEPVTEQEWEKTRGIFREALDAPLAAVDRQIARARDAAIFLAGAETQNTGSGDFYKISSTQNPIAHDVSARVGFACLFAETDSDLDPYDYRFCLSPPKRPSDEPPARGQNVAEWEEYARHKRMFESIWRASFDRLETHDGALLKTTRENGLACSRITPQAARLIVEEARARGWDQIVVRGGERFIQAIEQAARDIPGAPPIVVGRNPSFWEVIPLHPARGMREFGAANSSPFDAYERVQTPSAFVDRIHDGDILDDADAGPRAAFGDEADVTGFVREQLNPPEEMSRNRPTGASGADPSSNAPGAKSDDNDVDVMGFTHEQLESHGLSSKRDDSPSP